MRTATLTACAIFLTLCLFGTVTGEEGAKRNWKGAKSWLYQLQKIDLEAARNSPFDIIVTDYSADGTENRRFTREQIEKLKHSPKGRKLVLCYMSIGEAEDYRFYWKKGWRLGNPAFLDKENPDWKGNYKVKFWDPEWQRIIFGGPDSYLDKIMASGYDGVYLDIIDAYEYYEEKGRKTARREMVEFVKALACHGRETKKDSDFGIFPQNGEALLSEPDYLAVITGIGREDTFYGYPEENERTEPDFGREIQKYLDKAVRAGKVVLNVDYCTSPEKVRDAAKRASEKGYLEYCTVRALDAMNPPPSWK
ncbi:MAG: endo alpha-1,4 polygalactosaminidase [Armatimonadetes bacterium]|nr:endo alpha-1,4 polygalactosaminidase [Armatimonadota bacterium]